VNSCRNLRSSTRAPSAWALATAALAAAALPSSAAAGPGSGTGAWVWVLAAIGAIVLVFTLLRLRAGRGGSRRSLSDIADGRRILVARGRRVTEELTALTDVVAERDDEAITRQHQRALDVVAEVRSRVSRTSGQRIQAKAHHDLDEAEWLISGVRARLDGFIEPLLQRNGLPATCFFDGRHGLATVDIDLGGIALQRVPVRTCSACAVVLVRGERPHVGSVEIGGRSVPWPAAPRWCGAYGWAMKDLKHLHYDGEPIFVEPERPADGRPRQTVAERARGVRSRVLPVAPTVLSEDDPADLDDDLEAHAPVASEPAREHEREEPAVSNAFAAMDSEAQPTAEPAPAATGDTPAD
jgi:hypothetical protein